jgi:hypothetical protein
MKRCLTLTFLDVEPAAFKTTKGPQEQDQAAPEESRGGPINCSDAD